MSYVSLSDDQRNVALVLNNRLRFVTQRRTASASVRAAKTWQAKRKEIETLSYDIADGVAAVQSDFDRAGFLSIVFDKPAKLFKGRDNG